MKQRYLVLDYETRSKADLKRTGAFEYANHPSTEILCIAWRLGTREELPGAETKVWTPAIPSPYGELRRSLLNSNIKIVAHNALFEQVLTRYVLSKLISDPEIKTIPTNRWICTASQARALALPGKLEGACSALKLPVQKDMEGHRLMMKMSRPRKPTKNNPAIWNQKKLDLLRLMEYCKTDVDAETALFLTTAPLIPFEREVWKLDQKMNLRGFLADRATVGNILAMIGDELVRFESEAARITSGKLRSVAQRDAVLKWVRSQGLDLPDLRAKTVSDALSTGLAEGLARELLQVRADASKASTAKYEAFEMRTRTDGRVRDNFVYHIASTGRWGGAGVQPQNFPRPTLSQGLIDLANEVLADESTDLELIRLLFGNPLNLFSNLLRSMIIASPGKDLFGGDKAQIEVRVLFWLARHDAGIQAFIQGRDLYCEQATEVYKRTISKSDAFERQLGKKLILGAGFGLGKDRFFESCKEDGMEVTTELAATAIASYRSTHYPVVHLWGNIERAAIAAVRNPGKKYSVNRTAWFMEGKFLFCELPSGRRLGYYNPEIRMKATPWGEKRPTLYHWDQVGPQKAWKLNGTYGGKLTENVVQAVARDVMAAAMIRTEAAGYELLITVHDEILSERERGKGSVEEFERVMSESPPWADGLPIKVEGFTGKRYRK